MATITTRDELAKLREQWCAEGKKVGFTSGVFDLIHAGHVDYLASAKALCDILIVALNSDSSTKQYKGPDRPIVSQEGRAKLIAALEHVDYVFIFDELRNKTNIEILKPDLYIKGGDHQKQNLLSADIVESYGGKVELIPPVPDSSSSKIIDKILRIYGGKNLNEFATEEGATYMQIRSTKKFPAVFLDRDGTINEDSNYVSNPDQFKLLPNAIDGMKKLQNAGYKLIIITNQGGIGLGYFTKNEFYKVNSKMFKLLSEHGVAIDKIYFCPHSKAENCKCRKPGTALLERAIKEADIIRENCFMIGDKELDVETGKNFGCRTIRIKSERDAEEEKIKPDYVARDLLEAANFIIGEIKL